MGESAVFICHRCGSEFGFGTGQDAADNAPPQTAEEQLPLFQSESSTDVAGDRIEQGLQVKSEEPAAAAAAEIPETAPPPEVIPQEEYAGSELLPPQTAARIWPWLAAMLILIGGAGFWVKHEVWLDNAWFRSLLINIHLPLEVRNKDWYIIPGSIQAQWIKRSDGSQALFIEGRIENLLYSELSLPQIEIQFYSKLDPEKPVTARRLAITQPPTIEVIRRAPFKTPPADTVPVAARGQRGFVLLLESLPENTGDFTLTPITD